MKAAEALIVLFGIFFVCFFHSLALGEPSEYVPSNFGGESVNSKLESYSSLGGEPVLKTIDKSTGNNDGLFLKLTENFFFIFKGKVILKENTGILFFVFPVESDLEGIGVVGKFGILF